MCHIWNSEGDMNICGQFYILSDIIKVKLFILIPILYICTDNSRGPPKLHIQTFYFQTTKIGFHEFKCIHSNGSTFEVK